MTLLPALLLLFLCSSCGKAKDQKFKEEEVLRIDGSNIQGVYEAPLIPINLNTTLGVIGATGVHRSYDSFKAFVKLYIGDQGVIHKQTLHLGSRCPTIQDDVNGDGYIDLREAHFIVGNILIPLDGDLETQWGGNGSYPQGNGIAGGYFYERTASFSRMFEDLRDIDQNTLDDLEKIPYDQGVSLHQKVILILGVSNSMRLPDSIDDLGMNRENSLPIACGVLHRTDKFPAELYDHSDPVTNSGRLPRVHINPRTREHQEPDEFPVPIPPNEPRRRGVRQRLRRWWRNTFGHDDHPTE